MGDKTQFRLADSDSGDQVKVLCAESSADNTKFTAIQADDTTQALKVFIEDGASTFINYLSSITAAIQVTQPGTPVTKNVSVTDVAQTITLEDNTKTFMIINTGSKVIAFRFDTGDDYISMNPDDIIGECLNTSKVYLICPTTSDTSTVSLIYTI